MTLKFPKEFIMFDFKNSNKWVFVIREHDLSWLLKILHTWLIVFSIIPNIIFEMLSYVTVLISKINYDVFNPY